MFELVVALRVTDAVDIPAVAAALTRMRPMCLAEDGCLSWEALHSVADPRVFTLVERWVSEEAWHAHGAREAITQVYVPEIVPRVTREVHPCEPLGRGSV